MLTGASGFGGSHVLEALRAPDIPTALLLRPTSNRRFIAAHLPHVEVRLGTFDAPAALRDALAGVTHVVHCAGATKARRAADLHTINAQGTQRLVEAINDQAGTVQRLVHLSTLAAGRPGTASAPARESDPPQLVSEYARSKWAGERAVAETCRTEFVILRPPGVYGPRDSEFLSLFRAVKRGVAPQFGPRPQELSLVFAHDLAEVMVAVLTHAQAAGRTWNVASPAVVTGRELCDEIANALEVQARTVRLPLWFLRLACLAQGKWSLLSGRPSILSHGKYHELAAPGWVCDLTAFQESLGLACATPLREGVRATVAWYRAQGWL